MADGLDLELLEKFNKQLDATYTKLLQLDAELKKFEKLTTVDVKAGPGLRATARALDELARAMSRLSTTSSESIIAGVRNLFTFIKSLGKIKSSSVKGITDAKDLISELTDLLTKVQPLQALAKDLDINSLRKLENLFGIVFEPLARAITNFAKEAKPARFREISESFDALSELFRSIKNSIQYQKDIEASAEFLDRVVVPLFKAFENLVNLAKTLTPAQLTGLSDNLRSIAGFFRVIIEVAKQVETLKEETLDPKLFKALSPFITAVLGLMKATETITPARLTNAATAFRSIGTLFAVIGVTLANLRSIGRVSILDQVFKLDLVSRFTQLTSVVRALFYLAQSLEPSRLANLATAFQGLEGLFRSLGGVIELIQNLRDKFKFPTNLFRQLQIFQRIIDPLINLTREIARATQEGGGEGLAGFYALIRGLVRAVKLLDELRGKFTGFTNLYRQLQVLERIGGRLANITKRFADATRGTDTKSFLGLEGLIRGLSRTFKLLIDLESQFGGVKFGPIEVGTGRFIRSADLLERAGGRLANIFTRFGKIKADPKLFISLSRLLPGFIQFFRELSIVQSDLGAFKDIGKSLGKMEQVSKKLGKIFENISKGFKGVDPKGLVAALKTLPELGRLTQGFTYSDDFIRFIKDFGNAIKNLKIEDRVAKSLESLSRILKDLERVDEIQAKLASVGEGRGTNNTISAFQRLRAVISEAVTEGILRANFLLKVFGVLKRVVLEVGKAFFKFVFPPAVVAANLRSLAQIGNAIREIGDNIRDIGEQMRDAGQQLFDSFGVTRLFQSAAVQSAVGFDQLSTQVQTFGNLSGAATEQAEALAFEIGQKFPLSANDALSAILDLIKAGQDLGSIEFVLPAASNLAALSETGDLDGVINTLIAAEGAFETFAEGVEGTFDNIAIATDIIASGANVSTASVESLGEGLANVGTAANSFGLSLEETVAVLAIFEDAGLKAAEGGTALRSLLNALDRPQTAAALERLNISLFDEGGNRRPLNDIITDIGASLDGLPEAQRVAVLQQLSDTFGRQGLNILLGEGADGINAIVEEMNALPTAAEQAAQLLDNLAGDLQQLQGSVETFMLRAALPMLERFFRPFIQIGRLVIDSVLSLDESFFEFLGTAIALSSFLATLVAGFLVFTGVILQVGGTVFTVVGALLNLQLVLGGIIAFVTAFATGIIAITAALLIFLPLITAATAVFETLYQIFNQNAGGASTSAKAFFNTLGSAVKTVAEFIGSFLNLLNVFIFQTSAAEDRFDSLGAAIAGFFSGLLSAFTGGFAGDLLLVLRQMTQIFDAFSLFRNTQQEIGAITTSLLGFGGSVSSAEDSLERSRLETRLGELRDSLKTIFTDLVQNVPLFRDAVQSLFGDTSEASIQAFVDHIFTVLDQIGLGFTRIGSAVTTFLANVTQFDLGANFRGLLANLDQGFTDLTLGFVGLFESFFGSNQLTETIREAAAGGIGGIGSALLNLLLDSIYNAIISNRANLREAFLSVVDLFFAGLRNLRFITDLLGAGPISDLFESFEGVLRQLLGNVFDVLFNLLEGQSLGEALYNVFGDAIQPLFDLVDTVKNIGSTLGNAFSSLISAVFPLGQSLLDAAQNSFDFQGFLTGISGFLTSFNELFFVPLLQGDFGTIWQRIVDGAVNFFSGLFTQISPELTNIIGAGITFFSDFLGNLGQAFTDFIATIDTPEEFITLGQTILNKMIEGLAAALVLFTELTGIDPVAMLQTVADFFEDVVLVQGPTIFANLGTSIRDTLFSAINAAFLNLEDRLNIDFQPAIDTITDSFNRLITALGDLLNSTAPEGGTSLLQDIIGIITDLADAIASLFDAFPPRDTDVPNEPLQFIVNFAADIVALGIDTITDFVTAINSLFDFLKTADPEAITALAAAVGLLLAPLAAPTILAGIAALGTAIGGLITTVFTVIIPFAALFVVVRALIQSFDEILDIFTEIGQGDVGGAFEQFGDALLNIFANITEQLGPLINLIAGFFGFEEMNFDSDAVVALGRDLYAAFFRAGEALEITFDRIMADLQANLVLAARRFADALTPGDDTEFQRLLDFFDLAKDFSLGSLTDLSGSITTAADLDVAQSLAILNQEDISRQVRDDIRTAIEAGDPVPISVAEVITLSELEVLNRVIEDALFSGDIDVLGAIIDTGTLDTAQVQELADNILYAVEQGFITAAEGQELLLDLSVQPGETVIDADAKNQIVADAQAQLDAQVAEEPVVAEVPVTVEVEPAAEGSVADFQELENEANAQVAEVEQALVADPKDIEVPVTTTLVPAEGEEAAPETAFVEDSLDLAGADAEDVAALSADLEILQTRAQLVKIDLDALLPVLQQLGIDLGTIDTAFVTVNATMTLFATALTTINLSLTTMLLNMSLILLSLTALGLGFTLTGGLATLSLTQIELKFNVLHDQLIVLLQTMIQGFINVKAVAEQLAKTLAGIVANAQNVEGIVNDANAAASSGEGGGSEPPPDDGGNAAGGSFSGKNKKQRGYGKFQIGEGGSEVLFENGKMYLLSRGEGRIATLAQGLPQLRNDASTGLYPAPATSGVAAGGGSVSNVNIEGANITVSVNGASGDAEQIANEVISKIEAQQQNQNESVRRNLRINHRG